MKTRICTLLRSNTFLLKWNTLKGKTCLFIEIRFFPLMTNNDLQKYIGEAASFNFSSLMDLLSFVTARNGQTGHREMWPYIHSTELLRCPI